jgi:energy-coupling factor transporter transmembrane protein EcfT
MEKRYFERGAGYGAWAGLITFVISWIYCIASYGFLFGVGLGWLPSLIVAAVAYLLTMLLWGPVALVLGLLFFLAVINLMGGNGQPQKNTTQPEPSFTQRNGSFAQRMDDIMAGKPEPERAVRK